MKRAAGLAELKHQRRHEGAGRSLRRERRVHLIGNHIRQRRVDAGLITRHHRAIRQRHLRELAVLRLERRAAQHVAEYVLPALGEQL